MMMARSAIAGLLVTCVGAAVSSLAHAQDQVEVLSRDDVNEVARTSLASFEWLVGQWRGAGFDGEVEEVWVGPAGKEMQGMFRLVKEDKVVLRELMTLIDQEGRVTLRVKHFGPDFDAWEETKESADFELLRFDTGRFQFDGLTLTHDANQLTMHLIVTDSAGEKRIERIVLERRSRLVLFQ